MGNTLKTPQLEQNESEPPEDQAPDSIFTCEICIEPCLSTTQKFRNENLCTHPFCIDCMIRYIEVKLEDHVARIPCPGLPCSHMLKPLSIRPLLSPTIFDKWCDLLCDSTLLGVESCYCPYENCSAQVINECGGDVKKSTCPNCNRWFCFKCKMKWHAGFRCEESGEQRDQNDVDFGILAEHNRWMRCPRCRQFVDRIEGCRVMKCRCDTSFCYKCGEQINGPSCRCYKFSFWPYFWTFIISIFVCIILLLIEHKYKID